jgi:hypothetical protein
MAAEKGEQVLGLDGQVEPDPIINLGPDAQIPSTTRPVH